MHLNSNVLFWCAIQLTTLAIVTNSAREKAFYDDDELYYSALFQEAHRATDMYRKFQDAYKTEQTYLNEVQGSKSVAEDGPLSNERFAGIKSHSKLNSLLGGNVDPLQIYQGLYDTQQMRSPSQSDGPISHEDTEAATLSAARALERENQETVEDLSTESYREQKSHEVQNSLGQVNHIAHVIHEKESETPEMLFNETIDHTNYNNNNVPNSINLEPIQRSKRLTTSRESLDHRSPPPMVNPMVNRIRKEAKNCIPIIPQTAIKT